MAPLPYTAALILSADHNEINIIYLNRRQIFIRFKTFQSSSIIGEGLHRSDFETASLMTGIILEEKRKVPLVVHLVRASFRPALGNAKNLIDRKVVHSIVDPVAS